MQGFTDYKFTGALLVDGFCCLTLDFEFDYLEKRNVFVVENLAGNKSN